MQTTKYNILIDRALLHLDHLPGITGNWLERGPEPVDAILEIHTGQKTLRLYTEVKTQLRHHQLNRIIDLNRKFRPLLVIAHYIEPTVKDELRKEGINYLETNGNMFLHEDEVVLWVEGRKYEGLEKQKAGRAFTPTGLKILFHFLLDERLINLTYRKLADITQVGFGNINFILTDLKKQGFLVPLTPDQYKLVNKKELLERWLTGYKEKLKPTLLFGEFDFLDKEALLKWKELTLPADTCWGGEPAADLLTNYLHPEIFTLYTGQRTPELIKTLRLIPATKGKINIYQRFWGKQWDHENGAPPLLVYADLLINGDRRSRETAQKIFDAYLQDQFK